MVWRAALLRDSSSEGFSPATRSYTAGSSPACSHARLLLAAWSTDGMIRFSRTVVEVLETLNSAPFFFSFSTRLRDPAA